MARAKVNDAQVPLDGFSRQIDNMPQIEEAIAHMMELEEGYREYSQQRKTVLELLRGLEVQPDETIRIGRFSVTGKERRGGGFEVPPWTSVSIGEIKALD